MKKTSKMEQYLQDLLEKRNFEPLASYKDEATWSKLKAKELALLMQLFTAEGEYYLSEKSSKAIDSFNLCVKISPDDPLAYFRQGVAYSEQVNNTFCSTAACKAFEKAVQLHPDFFEAWYTWGCVLLGMGFAYEETALLQQADQKFSAASKCAQNDSRKLAFLNWQWGVCWHHQGHLSGEACDYNNALDKFASAMQYGLKDADFWSDYGESMYALAKLVGGKDLLLKACELFQTSVQAAPNNVNSCNGLACVLHRLYDNTNEEKYFIQAQEYYLKALKLDPAAQNVWVNWGTLLTEAGKRKFNTDMLSAAIEKFTKASTCAPESAILLSRWGEALMTLGIHTDRADFLRSAENKFTRSLELDHEHVDTWYLYGTCLCELGRFFGDEAYYYLAIEKFEYALTLNVHNPMLWHGSALAHFAIGDMCGDVSMFDTANAHCARVLEHTNQKVPAHFWNDWGVVLLKLSEITSSQQNVVLAIEKFEHALGLRESNEDNVVRDPEWWYNYGCAYDFLGDHTEDPKDYEKAINILTQVVEHDSYCVPPRYNLALAWTHLGELTENADCLNKSLEYFQSILNDYAEDENVWNDSGITLMNLADIINEPVHQEKIKEIYEKAERHFMNAIALGSTQAFYNLACLYSLVGNYQAAMHYIERSELAGSLPSIDDILYDEWLEGVRQTSDFRHFLTQLREAPHEE